MELAHTGAGAGAPICPLVSTLAAVICEPAARDNDTAQVLARLQSRKAAKDYRQAYHVIQITTERIAMLVR